MAAFVRANLGDILALIRAQVAARVRVPLEAVVLTTLPLEEVDAPLGERDVLIQLGNELPLPGRDGGGRHVNRRKRNLKVAARTRLHLDEPERDLVRLTHATQGHLKMEDLLVDCLESFIPTSAAGDALAQPLLCGEISPAARGTFGSHKSPSARLMSWFPASVEYVRSLDRSWE
jgi:hypothetical protein